MPDKNLVEQFMIPVDYYPVAHPEDTLLEAAFALRASYCETQEGVCSQAGFRCALVLDDNGSPAGILDFGGFWKTAANGQDPPDPRNWPERFGHVRVKEVMRPVTGRLFAQDDLFAGITLFSRHNVHILPVFKDDRVVGVLRDEDLFLALVDALANGQ